MTALRLLLTTAGLLLLGAGASSAQGFKTNNYNVNVSGQTTIMNAWTCWHGDCSFAHCQINDLKKPRLGTVTVRIRDTRIPAGNGTCSGKPIKGLDIIYKPKPGARGPDNYRARVTAENGGRYILNFNLNLR